ncbi:MAG: IclR family transcriptional regulator, partial [Microbacterium sp.]|nr:IclR family transcriptional regulator [Microbacterium sp.]
MRTSDWTDSAAVLDRLTALLEAFDDEDAGMGVSELARRANLPKSTVSRACTELVRHGLLDRQGDRLHLGIRLFEWGQAVEVPRT